jgi:hypothetical protein
MIKEYAANQMKYSQSVRVKAFLLTAITAVIMTTLTACDVNEAYAEPHPSLADDTNTPLPSESLPPLETENPVISEISTTPVHTPMQVLRSFTLEDASGVLTPAEAASQLVVRFMEYLTADNRDERTFTVTKYKIESVNVHPTIELAKAKAENPDEEHYALRDDEVSDTTWIVDPLVSFQYTGSVSPVGPLPNSDAWVQLADGSAVGFLLTRDRTTYTLRSRYQ